MPHLKEIHDCITAAAQAAARDASNIHLLAVSKGQPLQKILSLYAAGQRSFGESYIQEALEKIAQLSEKDIEWHFIGRLQSNKLRQIATHFDWVHSLSSVAHAEKMNQHRAVMPTAINVCIQVNISGETSKSGIVADQLQALAAFVATLPHLKLRGLMTMPDPTASNTDQQRNYKTLQALLSQLNSTGLNLDTLSMGMSNDYPGAIREGATIVRVGTALFGPREYKNL